MKNTQITKNIIREKNRNKKLKYSDKKMIRRKKEKHNQIKNNIE